MNSDKISDSDISKSIDKILMVKNEIAKVIINQEYMIDRLIIAFLTGGHILIEGLPGLAKSKTVSTFANVIGLNFKRIQFTPDLLPADIIGTEIYRQDTGKFHIKKGPLFSNLILADEINRAPAKVQSALLESMEERQITIGEKTYILEEPFMVIATQNPLEQHGTYPLPEAQQDRFMLKLIINYPSQEQEEIIIKRFSLNKLKLDEIKKVIDYEDVLEMRRIIDNIHVSDNIIKYVLDIVFKTREKSIYIECGASPRASINLIKASKCSAFLSQRNYVTPEDIKIIIKDVLRHRIMTSYEAEAENITSEMLINEILDNTNLP